MEIIRDIPYTENAAKEQVLDLYLPENKEFSAFIYFHGGGLVGGDKDNFPAKTELVEKGYAVISANYRLYPNANFPDFINDGAMAVAWVKNNISRFGKCNKIFIGGSSAGGYITQMLCFNKDYLAKHNIDADQIDGYVMDAGQPTSHFIVLKERGLDPRRIIVDETAPLYFIAGERDYPPMKIIVSDNDMENRLEQTMLLVSTLKHFKCDMSKVDLEIVKDSTHCQYVNKRDHNSKSIFADMIFKFISEVK